MPKTRLKRAKGRCFLEKTSTTREDLEKLAANGVSITQTPSGLLLPMIHIADGFFQNRIIDEDPLASERHIRDLMCTLERGESLPPILVTPIGPRFYVVDGHHRVAAYKHVGWKGPVPVEVFRGSLTEALVVSVERNSRNQLPMSLSSRVESAWRLVKALGNTVSAKGIANKANISERRVVTMRQVLREHGETVWDLTWVEAWGLHQADREFDPEWKDKLINDVVDALRRERLVGKIRKHPDIFSAALELIDVDFPRKFIELHVDTARVVAEENPDLGI